MSSSFSLSKRLMAVLMLFALFAVACGGSGSETAANGISFDGEIDSDSAAIAANEDLPTIEEVIAQEANMPDPTPLATVDPVLFATPTPEVKEDPWEVHVVIARQENPEVPVYSEPDDSTRFNLLYEYLSGTTIAYPLKTTTAFGNDLALLVVEGEPGDDWIKVQLPVRPTGTTAWVQAAFFDWSTHNYHVDIDVTNNYVEVWKGDELIVGTDAITGRPDRPTPVLTSYIDEKIPRSNVDGAYGPWILSIAAFSESIETFGEGGLPKLALHGTNEPQNIGEYVSSGCIRVENDIINLIAETVPVGTQIRIFS